MIIKINLDLYIYWKLNHNIKDMNWLKDEVEKAWREGAYPLQEHIKTAADYFNGNGYIPKNIIENWDEIPDNCKDTEDGEIQDGHLNDSYAVGIEWI